MKPLKNTLPIIRAFLLFVIVLVFLMIYTIYSKTNTLILQHFNQQQFLLVSSMTTSMQSFLTGMEHELKSLATVMSFSKGSGIEDRILLEDFYRNNHPAVERIIRVGPSGLGVCGMSSRGISSGGADMAEEGFDGLIDFSRDTLFQTVSSGRETHWRTLEMDRWGTRTVSVAMPILKTARDGDDAQDSFDGVIMLFISGSFIIDQYLVPVDADINFYTWTLDYDGRILNHTTLPELIEQDSLVVSQGEAYRELRDTVLNMLKGEKGTARYFFRGEKKYVAYAPMTIGDIRWSVAVSMPISEMISPIRTGYWHNLVLFGVIIGFFGLLAAIMTHMANQADRGKKDLRILYGLRAIFSTSRTLEDMVNRILDVVVERENIHAAMLFLCTDNHAGMKMAASRNVSEELLEEFKRKPPQERMEYRAVSSGEQFLSGGQVSGGWLSGRKRGLSWLSLPLFVGERTIGVLSLGSSKEGLFSDKGLPSLEIMADELGIVLDNIMLFQTLKDKTVLLEEANRVKSEFPSMVSHELRTPLSVVIGFLNLLNENRFDERTDEMKELCKIANKRAHDLERLIEDLLDLTRIEEGRIQISYKAVDSKKIVQTVHRFFSPQAQKQNIKLSLDLPRKLPYCMADMWKTRQIMDNLVGNALKFTPSGGSVIIGAHLRDGRILFSVSDTGPGIPNDKLETIFDRFYQVDSSMTRNHGGTGLGLSISRELAKLQGGNLWAENVPGRGAIFYLSLKYERRSQERKKDVRPMPDK